MKKRHTPILYIILAIILFLSGCKEIDNGINPEITEYTAAELPYPVDVGSFIFNAAPENTASLSPALTEIICELGYEELLIGISRYCDYPESISDRNIMGSSANPDVEAIIKTAPVLLVSQSPIAKKDITAIEAAGTRVFIHQSPTTVNELYGMYENISAVFGGRLNAKAAAEDAAEPLKKALHENDIDIGSFVYLMDSRLSVANGNTFIGDFFSNFGTNAITDGSKLSLTSDEFLELNPDYIFVPEPLNADKFSEKLSELSAVKNGRVVVVSYEAQERLERPTSRLSEVVYEITGLLTR